MNTDKLIRSSRRTVLVVEDEAINREVLGLILSERYDVVYAENGLAALKIIRERGDALSMILLDINMPVMNGIELLKLLNTEDMLPTIPVIVLTADKDAELESLQLGAMDFLTKPYDMPEIILARVRRIIEFVEDRQIIREVERDELTGLYTHGFFLEYCRRLIAADSAHRRDMIAVDIDHFRLVNEIYGKAFGDEVLCAVSDGILEALGERFGIACRSSADLFFLFADHIEEPAAFYDTVARKVQALGQGSIRLRMGIYRDMDGTHSVEWYSDAAKAACGTLRGNYASSISVYDEAIYHRELYNERLIADIDDAIREKQFKVYFQPKYDVRGDEPRLYGAEALVRWQHPELGFISPGAFIPLFEENGLITKLDDFVWRQSAEYLRAWRERYGVRLPVSVNLSRKDLFDPTLKDRLLAIVQENGIPEEDMVLEVTESAYAQDTDRMVSAVKALRDAGFRTEMDDFGSGYSSLNMLCMLPIDALKIDMRFVRNLVESGGGYRILELVIEIAHSLPVPAIVEGVEDKEQCRLVRQAGCDVVQGYCFSRPLPAEEFEALLLRP